MKTNPAQSCEAALTRDKALRMSNGELASEIVRCRHGMKVAANRTAAMRFERRLHIMQEEADSRIAYAGGGR